MTKTPTKPLPVANLTVYDFKRDFNKKFKAYDVTVVEDVVKAQPFGGDGRDADGIYPVPHVVRQTRDQMWVEYEGTGMGDQGWKNTFYRTAAAARKAALKWLGDRTEMTEEQKAEAARDVKMKELKEARKWLKGLEKNVTEWKKKVAKLEAEVA